MPPSSDNAPLRILVYSDNPRTREQVRLALGKRVHPELPELTYLEVATGPMVIKQMDAGGFDLVILDGEATPVGGMGIAKQLKDEITDCPPILVLTGRPDDAWLARWSQAEAAVPHPIDPIRLGDAVVSLLRTPCSSSQHEFACRRWLFTAQRCDGAPPLAILNPNVWHATQTR